MSADASEKRKMSEMISEMAGNFIGFGKTPEEKDARLTAACSAWNLACVSPELRQQQLDQYIERYQQFSPAISPSDLANIRTDMESLIKRKLEMFPDDLRQIVGAQVVMVGDRFRIEVENAHCDMASYRDEEVGPPNAHGVVERCFSETKSGIEKPRPSRLSRAVDPMERRRVLFLCGRPRRIKGDVLAPFPHVAVHVEQPQVSA